MKKTTGRETMPGELAIAIGLVWGHLSAGQIEDAAQLARGCLGIWPQETRLAVMAAYAAVELGEPLDAETVSLLNETGCVEWARIVIRRADELTSNPRWRGSSGCRAAPSALQNYTDDQLVSPMKSIQPGRKTQW